MEPLRQYWQELAGGRWVGYPIGLVAVAAVSVVIQLVSAWASIPNVSMLYLLAVLGVAIACGRGAAIVTSVVAFLVFDWFFVDPVGTFTVGNPDEWVALLLFLVTAIITGQLAAEQRRRAREAEAREREAVVLYDVARLLRDLDLAEDLRLIAERLCRELRLEAVTITADDQRAVFASAEAGNPDALAVLHSTVQGPTQVLSEGTRPNEHQRSGAGRWVRVVPPGPPPGQTRFARERLRIVPIKTGGLRVGSLRLVRPNSAVPLREEENRLLSAVAGQIGLAVERARLQREATEAELLRRTDELKTQLLNTVSHDLRTPLASIVAAAGSLLQNDVDWTAEERCEFAEAIESEARRLNGIVGNLLDLSRLEGGNLRPEKRWYDLASLVDDVLGRLRPITKGHPVRTNLPANLPPIPLDYVEIDQVLSNLIENAARYTPPGTEIDVSATVRGDTVEVEVADRGPGIPPASLRRLFEPFYRAAATDGRPKPGGTGLGLAVVRGLVEAHGGTIRVQNRQDGGAQFVFTLPLSIGPGATATAAVSQ